MGIHIKKSLSSLIRSYFLQEDQRYDVFPGTQIMASIRTGKRTVVVYLLNPFWVLIKEARREP